MAGDTNGGDRIMRFGGSRGHGGRGACKTSLPAPEKDSAAIRRMAADGIGPTLRTHGGSGHSARTPVDVRGPKPASQQQDSPLNRPSDYQPITSADRPACRSYRYS